MMPQAIAAMSLKMTIPGILAKLDTGCADSNTLLIACLSSSSQALE